MKNIKKLLLILFVSFIILSLMNIEAFASGGFTYVHDPTLNPYAMQDIIVDENAIYGFRPSETGSLKAYADADWSSAEVVEKGRQERIAYHESIEAMYDILEDMTAQGKSIEEIARAVSTKRNEIRLAAYDNDPEGLQTLKARNLEKYGHEEGPLPDELYEQYGSWETVTAKAFSVNAGMDACLGLYDDYYDVYVALGQVEEVPEVSDQTGADETGPAAAEVAENSAITAQSNNAKSPKTSDGNGIIYVVLLISGGAFAIAFRRTATETL